MGSNWRVITAAWALVAAVSKAAFGQAHEPQALEPGSHFEVALHGRSMEASARTERVAFITLRVPFDRLASPRVVEPPSAPVAVALTERAASASTSASGAAQSDAPLTFQQLQALSDFARQATVAALAVVGTAGERRRLDGLSSRARLSALLPELRLRALRNSDQALRWIPTTDDPYRITQADGTGLILEASATFRLDRLLFAREELAVARLRHRAGAERLKLEARVVEALLGLFRARELGCADAEGDAAHPGHSLKVLELFVELDALTAGWFADRAPELGRAIWGFPEAVLGQCSAPSARLPVVSATNPVASLENSE